MSNARTNPEVLRTIASALDNYIGSVSTETRRLNSAAQDCSDIMEGDDASAKAVKKIEECCAQIPKALMRASELSAKLRQEAARLDDYGSTWGQN